MPDIYEETKNLFKTSQEAFEIYNLLKCKLMSKYGDILYIYKNIREAEKAFWKYVSIYRGVTYNTEQRKIYFPEENTKIYFKAIDECKNHKRLAGYIFKEVHFEGE